MKLKNVKKKIVMADSFGGGLVCLVDFLKKGLDFFFRIIYYYTTNCYCNLVHKLLSL